MVKKFKLDQYYDDAQTWLQQFPPFKAYLQQLKTPSATRKFDPSTNYPGPWGAGIFEIPVAEQVRISSALLEEEVMNKSKRLIDEDSVNMSLVAFLIAVASKHPLLNTAAGHPIGSQSRLSSAMVQKWRHRSTATLGGKKSQ